MGLSRTHASWSRDPPLCVAHRKCSALLLNECSFTELTGESALPPSHSRTPLPPPSTTAPRALSPRFSTKHTQPLTRIILIHVRIELLTSHAVGLPLFVLEEDRLRARKHRGRGETPGNRDRRGEAGEGPCGLVCAPSPLPHPESLLTPQSAHVSPSMR